MDAQRSEQQGSFVRWIAEAIWHRDFMDRTMIPFTGYCDESEQPPRCRFLIAAGLIAPTNRWIQFEYNWKLVLAHYNVDYFHAIEFYNNKGPWRRGTEWDDDNYRARFLAELFNVVQSTEFKPDVAIVSLVWKEAYKAIFPRHDIVKQSAGTAYTLACTGCWWLGSKWADENHKTEKIHFFFDEGNQHVGEAAVAYQKTKSYPPYETRFNLGGLTFANDKDFIPLQAADLLAYGVIKNLSGRAYAFDVGPIIKDFTGGHFPYMVLVQDEDYLRTIRREHVRQLRERGRKGVVD
jgi:uncharacterized membrane protein YfbV (UPF0208 family)